MQTDWLLNLRDSKEGVLRLVFSHSPQPQSTSNVPFSFRNHLSLVVYDSPGVRTPTVKYGRRGGREIPLKSSVYSSGLT